MSVDFNAKIPEAIEALSPRNSIVGIDPSLEMLRLAQGKGLLRLVGGQVPGLPFPDSTFDGIMASFLLSHLSEATRRAIPWEEWFSEATDLREALQDAGLLSVDVQDREYRVSLTVADYLSIRETV